jgi:hypothetical protein
MAMSEAEVLAECHHALADTEFAPEQVRVFRLSELGTGHVSGAWFRPHTEIESSDRMFPGNDEQREDANSTENRRVHRIAIPAEPTDPVLFAALLRHELEHARQWDAAPGIFDLQDFIENDILPRSLVASMAARAGSSTRSRARWTATRQHLSTSRSGSAPPRSSRLGADRRNTWRARSSRLCPLRRFQYA